MDKNQMVAQNLGIRIANLEIDIANLKAENQLLAAKIDELEKEKQEKEDAE